MSYSSVIPPLRLLLCLPMAVILCACGKQEATLAVSRPLVSNEEGALPMPGTASRLLKEQSTFLRKHGSDSVDWHSWGPEALALAKKENKPILVSIGYASCPWSQKMQDHAFTKPELTRFQNKHFVNILVDREERPDLNNSFLHFAAWKTRQSGWPMHIWLTPEGMPYHTATYLPEHSEDGYNGASTPSWRLVMEKAQYHWSSGPDETRRAAKADAEVYRKYYEKIQSGPDLAGARASDIIKLIDLPDSEPQEKLSHFMKMRVDDQQRAISDLSQALLGDILGGLDTAGAERLIDRVNPTAAGYLCRKAPEKMLAAAYQRMVWGSRSLALQTARQGFNTMHGGFSPPPRFILPAVITTLLNVSVQESTSIGARRQAEAMEMVTATLDAVMHGGILDQLDGGFHRYSNDAAWRLPQFEKMSYDQGFNSSIYLYAYQVTGRKEYADVVKRALGYLTTELRHPEGGFYSAEGSSSMAKRGDTALSEGAYYLWTYDDIRATVGAEAMPLLTQLYDLQEFGNLPMDAIATGRLPKANVLSVEKSLEAAARSIGISVSTAQERLAAAKVKLLAARAKRERPTLDNKVLAGWNGMLAATLVTAGRTLQDPSLTEAGVKCMDFVLQRMRRADGTIAHSYIDGPSSTHSFCEDFAGVIQGLLALYETTGESKWLEQAHKLQEQQLASLWVKDVGGFLDGLPVEGLFHRVKSLDENTEFAASALSCRNLMHLHGILGIADYKTKCRELIARHGPVLGASPLGNCRLLHVAELSAMPVQQIVISGTNAAERARFAQALNPSYLPYVLRIYHDGGEGSRLLAEHHKTLRVNAPTASTVAYYCIDGKVERTFASPGELSAWAQARSSVPRG